MRVSLTFRLFMMRYAIALLASSCVSQDRPAFSKDIGKKVSEILSKRHELPEERLEEFKEYLIHKPSTRKYSPIRHALSTNKITEVENQDLQLADPNIRSSVGALTQDYFGDALSLAHTLKLVQKDNNLLLARGRLSLSTSWSKDHIFRINEYDSFYLGLWLLDIDCDWIRAFLCQIPTSELDFEINLENRVELLLKSWEALLNTKSIRSNNPQTIKVRSRINELAAITRRNIASKLNLGQPWSWFYIPRLELMVDAGILQKNQRHGLTGYSLTATGRKFQLVSKKYDSGDALLDKYFYCRDTEGRSLQDSVEWEVIEERLSKVASILKTSVGFYPIFETAAALCVSQYLDSESGDKSIWEIEQIKFRLLTEAKSPASRVRLAIDRMGHIYAFKQK